MRKALPFFKKILFLAATSSACMMLACCYGVPFDYVGTWLIKPRKSSGEAIPGLRVTLLRYSAGNAKPDTISVQDGYEEWPIDISDVDAGSDGRVAALVQDMDDTANGGAFADTVIYKPAAAGADTTVVEMRARP